MGKVVVLGGNARSGKSTLSFMLVNNGFSRISLDNIHNILKDGLDIDIDNFSKEKKFKMFESIVNQALEESVNENTNIVIDMYDYLPEDINNLEKKDKLEVYFLAYPGCNKEEIKANVIKYSKPTDWISQVNDKYLNECVERFYDRNKTLINECQKYKMKLIDTKSGKERNKVLNDLLNKIINSD